MTQTDEYIKAYAAWLAEMSPEERARAVEMGVDSPLLDSIHSHKGEFHEELDYHLPPPAPVVVSVFDGVDEWLRRFLLWAVGRIEQGNPGYHIEVGDRVYCFVRCVWPALVDGAVSPSVGERNSRILRVVPADIRDGAAAADGIRKIVLMICAKSDAQFAPARFKAGLVGKNVLALCQAYFPEVVDGLSQTALAALCGNEGRAAFSDRVLLYVGKIGGHPRGCKSQAAREKYSLVQRGNRNRVKNHGGLRS